MVNIYVKTCFPLIYGDFYPLMHADLQKVCANQRLFLRRSAGKISETHELNLSMHRSSDT